MSVFFEQDLPGDFSATSSNPRLTLFLENKI